MSTEDLNVGQSFGQMLCGFEGLTESAISSMNYISSHPSMMNPATFLMLQFQMSMMTQVGEAISNMLAAINSLVSSVVRNFKS